MLTVVFHLLSLTPTLNVFALYKYYEILRYNFQIKNTVFCPEHAGSEFRNFLLGTVYYRAEERDGILLMSAYCVYCCASPLFLSSVLMAHLNKALEVSFQNEVLGKHYLFSKIKA